MGNLMRHCVGLQSPGLATEKMTAFKSAAGQVSAVEAVVCEIVRGEASSKRGNPLVL